MSEQQQQQHIVDCGDSVSSKESLTSGNEAAEQPSPAMQAMEIASGMAGGAAQFVQGAMVMEHLLADHVDKDVAKQFAKHVNKAIGLADNRLRCKYNEYAAAAGIDGFTDDELAEAAELEATGETRDKE